VQFNPLKRQEFVALIAAAVVLIWAPGFLLAQIDPDPLDTEYTSNDDREIDPDVERELPFARQYRAFLPASIDLSSRMPAPGNQGRLKSCQAWAIAYARSYYTASFEGRDARVPANLLSPSYVYHMARGSECGTMNPIDVINVLKKGALSVQEYPYNDQCTAPPSGELVRNARNFRVEGYRKVNVGVDAIKGQLAWSNPVLISFADSTAFKRHRGDGNFADPSFDAAKDGWHAMTIVGYDDGRRAFRLINSWGQGWGDRGYAWLSYDLVPIRIRYAGVLEVAKPSRPVAFLPPSSPAPSLRDPWSAPSLQSPTASPHVPVPSQATATKPTVPGPAQSAKVAENSPVGPAPGSQRVNSVVKSVASGIDSLVGSPAAWDKNCNARPIQVKIIRGPVNGTISIVDGMVETGQIRVGSDPGGCAGKPMPGKRVLYRSKPGFHGLDGITYEVTTPAGGWSTAVTISVQ